MNSETKSFIAAATVFCTLGWSFYGLSFLFFGTEKYTVDPGYFFMSFSTATGAAMAIALLFEGQENND